MRCKKINKSFKRYNFIITFNYDLLLNNSYYRSSKKIDCSYSKREQAYKEVYNLYKNADIIFHRYYEDNFTYLTVI